MAKKPTQTPNRDVVEAEPYNGLGDTVPFRGPQASTARVHLRAGKGGGAKSAGTNVHADLLRSAGATLVWTNAEGALPEGGGATCTLFDLETANPTLGRYHPDLPDHQRCGTLDAHELGDMLLYKILPLAQQGCTVLVDFGAQGEVPALDYIEMHDLSDLIGESFVWHVPIYSIDSVGNAISIAERSPATPVILYLLHKEAETKMLLRNEQNRDTLDRLYKLPNVIGAIDFPDLRAAFTISSRTNRTLLEVLSYEKANLFERQICRKALTQLQAAWHPATAWLSC